MSIGTVSDESLAMAVDGGQGMVILHTLSLVLLAALSLLSPATPPHRSCRLQGVCSHMLMVICTRDSEDKVNFWCTRYISCAPRSAFTDAEKSADRQTSHQKSQTPLDTARSINSFSISAALTCFPPLL